MSKPSFAIVGGHVLDPASNIDKPMSILVRNGYILDLIEPYNDIGEGWQEFPVNGLTILPGFIDMHTHLREPGEEWKETIKTGIQAAAKGGFTTICAMPNTLPPMDTPQVIHYVTQKAKEIDLVKVLPIAAITKGRNGQEITQMHKLAELGVVGFSDDGSAVANSAVMRLALSVASFLDLPIINHAEDPALVNDGVMHEGHTSFQLGLPSSPAEAEAIMVIRDIHLAQLENCKLHIPHVSSYLSLKHITDAKLQGARVTAEVTPHHLTMSEDWVMGNRGQSVEYVSTQSYDPNTKVNPPLRSQKDRVALVNALGNGTIDALATDHAPHSLLEKEGTFVNVSPGINALETAFALSVTLVHKGEITLSKLIRSLTSKPASILGIQGGSLSKGMPADITIVDTQREWTVEPEHFASKSVNTPLIGMKLRGKVIATFCNGELAYYEEVNRK